MTFTTLRIQYEIFLEALWRDERGFAALRNDVVPLNFKTAL